MDGDIIAGPRAGDVIETLVIPGTTTTLEYRRTAAGRLIGLRAGGRTYLHEAPDGARVFDGGLAVFREVNLPRGLIRNVDAGRESWSEEYLWDATGRPTQVDGVTIERDEKGRILACLGPDTAWHYGYARERLAVIDGPRGLRHIARGTNGRPVTVRGGSQVRTLRYNDSGIRLDTPRPPAGWHRDALGRLWSITGPDGSVVTTYLWNGFACLGRIDGGPGDPLAAVFSLDMSCTPVRIITRQGMRRIPRDAFGEGLLDLPGTPGLYGGAVHDRYVHMRGRVLDPDSGAFDRPDPFDGLMEDPRRDDGYDGALLVEHAGPYTAGPYTVCQNDPVGRIDPTGEISVPLLLSDFTWSIQNNLGGWFGMDFTLNFWIDMLSFGAGGLAGKFFSFEGLASERSGSFGVRRDGVFAGARAFTFQHEVWNSAALFDVNPARLFDPGGAFRPNLYGTLLHGAPVSGTPFLLSGNRDPATVGASPMNWTRHGGAAEPVAPGAVVARFPSGGLHFDQPSSTLNGRTACTMTELVPSHTIVTAAAAQASATLVLPGSGLDLAAGGFVLLTDAAAGVDIKRIATVTPQGANTSLRLEDAVLAVAATQVRLRGLGAPGASETLTPIGPAGRLGVGGSAAPYLVGDALRLSQAGAKVGAALISAFEARLQIDGAIPAGFTTPLTVRAGAAPGTGAAAALAGNVLTIATGPLPAAGDAIVLGGGGVEAGAVVVGAPAATTRTLDRTAGDLASLGAAVTWRPMAPGLTMGTAAVADAGATLTFNPAAPRTAPASGFIVVEAAGSPITRTARVVRGLDYDAVVAGAALPGNAAAAFQVERLVIQPPDLPDLAIVTNPGLTLPPGVTLPGAALQLNQLATPAIAAGAGGSIGATIAGTTATLAAASVAAHTPSQLLVLRRGSALEFAVVAQLRVTIVLDRSLTFDPAGVEIVPLLPNGFIYAARRRDALVVSVQPLVGATPVQMPRIAVGETVQVNWTEALRPRQFRVAAADGSTLTLEGDQPIPGPGEPASVTNLAVQRLIPGNPATGSTRLAIAGIPAAPTSDTLTVQVWQPGAFSVNTVIGVVTGNRTLPARISTPRQAAFVDLTAAPAMGNGITDLTIANATIFYAAGFTQNGVDLIVQGVQPALPAGPSPNLMVIVPYVTTPVTATGTLGSGSMKVPEDPEHWELDFRDSLRDHELTHTLQAATWGPLFLGFLPLFAVEGLLEGVTDVELPAFSAYVAATAATENGNWFLTIPDAHGIDFTDGSSVQVSSASLTPRTVALGAKDATGRIAFSNDGSIPTGDVQIRRRTGDNGWTKLRDVTYNTLHILTVGGVLNLVAGSVWGGLIFAIGKLIYFLRHRVFHAGDEFPATIEQNGAAVRMSSPDGKIAVLGFNSVVIKSPNDSTERDLTGNTDGLLTLKESVTYTGSVTVVPYKTDDIADGLDFYPATVPDPARPASVKPATKNGATLTLHAFDRVALASGITSVRTNVTAANADGTFDLADAPTTTGADRALRIAKVDENDPMGSADSRALTEMGMGWMRWLFDPYAQFQYRLHPTPGSPADWIARIARYLLSTHSWSAAIPGHLFLDDLFKQPNNGHLSGMEQDASENSGNLYSPLGRIRGGFSRQDGQFATYTATIGDIARYWHAMMFFTSAQVPSSQRDAPGVQMNPLVHVIANVQNGAGAQEPNQGAQSSDTAHSARFLPDALFAKNAASPEADAVTAPTPSGFNASDRGLIPTSATLEFTTGIYAAFTRPGTHRITVQDGITSAQLTRAQRGREAQAAKTQTLWFDVVTADVDVRVAGSPVAQADPPDAITMIPRQRAAVTVGAAVDPARRYAVTVTTPGRVVRPDNLALVAADDTTETESVEISRIYRFDGTTFDDPVLNAHSMHLATDLHIPVRQFTVRLTTTLTMRQTADPNGVAAPSRQPGETGFVLVPASIAVGLARGAVTYAAIPPAGTVDPTPAITLLATPPALAGFIGDGAVFQVDFGADDPPEEPATVAFTVSVGQPGNSVALSASVAYTPFFRLTAPAFSVARGAPLVLACTDGVSAGQVSVLPPDGVTISQAGAAVTLTVAAAAPIGSRRVLVADAANATHKARRTIQITA